MVLDAARGIEARTRKLFEVCRLRDIPIVTFINKLDRETRDPFELLDEIERRRLAPGRGAGHLAARPGAVASSAPTIWRSARCAGSTNDAGGGAGWQGPDDPYIEGLMKAPDFAETVEQIELGGGRLEEVSIAKRFWRGT